ncbi:ATP-binding cassette domain-containing protein, partial [Abiotrophia defectiva]
MIEVKNLSVSYGSKAILKQLNFQIKAGEVVGLVGPNGAGKTTLLSALTGLLPYSEGQVKVAQLDLPAGKSLYRKIGFMQDNSVLYPQLTGYDHLQYIALAQGLSKESIIETAERVGMIGYLDQAVGTYSL